METLWTYFDVGWNWLMSERITIRLYFYFLLNSKYSSPFLSKNSVWVARALSIKSTFLSRTYSQQTKVPCTMSLGLTYFAHIFIGTNNAEDRRTFQALARCIVSFACPWTFSAAGSEALNCRSKKEMFQIQSFKVSFSNSNHYQHD